MNPYVNIDELNFKSRGASIASDSNQTTSNAGIESTIGDSNATRFSIDLEKLSPLTVSNKNIYFGSTNNYITKKDDVFENSIETNLKPEHPIQLTHYEDFDDEDDDSDELISQGSQPSTLNK